MISTKIDSHAAIIDCGGQTTRIGDCCDDSPHFVIPSSFGSKMSDSGSNIIIGDDLSYPRIDMEIGNIIQDGLVADWDAYEAILNYALYNKHALNWKSGEKKPLLLSGAAWSPQSERHRQFELVFETGKADLCFLARSPSLATYSVGRSNALVLDVGHHLSSACAVIDGFTLTRSVVRSVIAGELLQKALDVYINQKKGQYIQPFYKDKSGKIPDYAKEYFTSQINPSQSSINQQTYKHSFCEYHRNICYLQQIKEQELIICPKSINDPQELEDEICNYELPDGSVINIDKGKSLIPELLWDTSSQLLEAVGITQLVNMKLVQSREQSSSSSQSTITMNPLIQTLIDSVKLCDASIRRDLWSGLLLVGGTACMKGLPDRFFSELNDKSPASVHVKIITSNVNDDKRFAVWLGGAILSSLESFSQRWPKKNDEKKESWEDEEEIEQENWDDDTSLGKVQDSVQEQEDNNNGFPRNIFDPYPQRRNDFGTDPFRSNSPSLIFSERDTSRLKREAQGYPARKVQCASLENENLKKSKIINNMDE
ncbi:MAG: putative actin superfamily [Streblomastix strix]|uniref:Putative actin superfamily n=1 Tax=Streblomastix strix TaxID=222440 RepID=A0A5J4WXZ3_9EUKA|nr:MAG: putative actin superfamily [Streblomastix strix]